MLKNFLLAISFLTIFPAYGRNDAAEKDMASSLYFYPLVGFLLGGILVGTDYLSSFFSTALGADALVVAAWIIFTGALHLDGLMDSGDGLFSGRDREKKLDIMKDSRIGAMGAITLAAVLMLKLAFLSELEGGDKWIALLVAPAVGRCVMVYAIGIFPYARVTPGLGNSFGSEKLTVKILGATLILLAGTYLIASYPGWIAVTFTALAAYLIAIWMAHSLGGMTGDTYGALCETTETLFVMIWVMCSRLFA